MEGGREGGKILLDETELSYICQTFERFSHVSTVLVREGWREGEREGWREGGKILLDETELSYICQTF